MTIPTNGNTEGLIRYNFEEMKEKIKSIVLAWGKRNLTLYGKITVIKSSIISQITYAISVLPNPEHSLFKEIDKITLEIFCGTTSTTKLEKYGIIKVFTRGLRHYNYIELLYVTQIYVD